MKPFDLQKALAGHPIVTREGNNVIHFWHKGENENLVVLESGQIYWVSDLGNPFTIASDIDLFLAPKEETIWIAISKQQYESSHGLKYYESYARVNIDSLKHDFPESKYTYEKITREVE